MSGLIQSLFKSAHLLLDGMGWHILQALLSVIWWGSIGISPPETSLQLLDKMMTAVILGIILGGRIGLSLFIILIIF